MPARLKTRGWDHSTRRGPLQLHFGAIDIGPHDLPKARAHRRRYRERVLAALNAADFEVIGKRLGVWLQPYTVEGSAPRLE